VLSGYKYATNEKNNQYLAPAMLYKDE